MSDLTGQPLKVLREQGGWKTAQTVLRFTPDLVSSIRALSSVGSERLPYKQEVGGSNPSAPIGESHETFQLKRYRSAILVRMACTVLNARNSISFLPCSMVRSAGTMLIPLIEAFPASIRSCRRTCRGSSFMMMEVM